MVWKECRFLKTLQKIVLQHPLAPREGFEFMRELMRVCGDCAQSSQSARPVEAALAGLAFIPASYF